MKGREPKIGDGRRLKILRHRVAVTPIVSWQVAARKLNDRRFSWFIRNMWQAGDYGT